MKKEGYKILLIVATVLLFLTFLYFVNAIINNLNPLTPISNNLNQTFICYVNVSGNITNVNLNIYNSTNSLITFSKSSPNSAYNMIINNLSESTSGVISNLNDSNQSTFLKLYGGNTGVSFTINAMNFTLGNVMNKSNVFWTLNWTKEASSVSCFTRPSCIGDSGQAIICWYNWSDNQWYSLLNGGLLNPSNFINLNLPNSGVSDSNEISIKSCSFLLGLNENITFYESWINYNITFGNDKNYSLNYNFKNDDSYKWNCQVNNGTNLFSSNNSLIIDTTNPQISFVNPTETLNYKADNYFFINVSSSDTNFANLTINLLNNTGGNLDLNVKSKCSNIISCISQDLNANCSCSEIINEDSIVLFNSNNGLKSTFNTVNPSYTLINISNNLNYNLNITSAKLKISFNMTSNVAGQIAQSCSISYSVNNMASWSILNNSCSNHTSGTDVYDLSSLNVSQLSNIIVNMSFKRSIPPSSTFIFMRIDYVALELNYSKTTSNFNTFINLSVPNGFYYFNATACDLANNCNSTETRNLTVDSNINITINLFNYSNNQLFSKSYLYVNTSTSFGTNISYCSFTSSPFWNFTNFSSINSLNQILSTNETFLNQSGTFQPIVTCYNNLGQSASSSKYLIISPYTLATNPSNNTLYQFQAINSRTERNGFNISLWDNTLSDVKLNINSNIQDLGNFSLNITNSIMLNSSDNSSNFFTIPFYLNASNNIANGTYLGNITFSNTTYGINYVIRFSYGINPPSGIPSISSISGIKCSDSSYSTCANYLTLNPSTSYSVNYFINNSGGFRLSNCSVNFTNSLSDFPIIFSNNSFDLNQTQSLTETITFNPNNSGTFFGNFYVTCQSGNLLNNPVQSFSSNNPFTFIFVPNVTSPSNPSGGGGGGSTVEKIPVIGLNQINSSMFYSELEREIIYAQINKYCGEKLNNQGVITQDYSDLCSLSSTDLQAINKRLSDLQVILNKGDLDIFYNLYLAKSLFQGYATQADITKYSLYSTVLGIVNSLVLTPPSIDTPILINQKSGSYTITNVSQLRINANKPIKSCDIIENNFLTCTVNGSVIHLSYKIDDTNFFSKIFTGKVSVRTDAEQSKVEIRTVSIVLRVYNTAYEYNGVSISSILIASGILVSITGYYFLRKRLKKEIKTI